MSTTQFPASSIRAAHSAPVANSSAARLLALIAEADPASDYKERCAKLAEKNGLGDGKFSAEVYQETHPDGGFSTSFYIRFNPSDGQKEPRFFRLCAFSHVVGSYTTVVFYADGLGIRSSQIPQDVISPDWQDFSFGEKTLRISEAIKAKVFGEQASSEEHTFCAILATRAILDLAVSFFPLKDYILFEYVVCEALQAKNISYYNEQ